MYKRISLLFFFACILIQLHAQVGIGTINPHGSAKLEIQSTTQGLLLPRMKAAQRDAIQGPALGLLVFQTNVTMGIYFYDGSSRRILTTGFIPNHTGYSLLPYVPGVTKFAGSFLGFANGPATTAKFNVRPGYEFFPDSYCYLHKAL